jgi:ABC-type nitrate/sulfonate/bicarbonate transport system substrate-binding protein
MRRKVRVGGVPEHFNLAWHLAIEEGKFDKCGIDIEWLDVPGGTGAMCQMLRNGEIDMAIALTEGVISDIIHGNPSKIVQFYVNSPLRWGIYTSEKNELLNLENIEGKKYAISRYKSGSHLMVYVNASRLGINIIEDDFLIIGNLQGARKALASQQADLFMWEKFTTKPFVDNGEFRFLGECKTPWPCFVVAATDEFITTQNESLHEILDIINQSCQDLKSNQEAVDLIAWRYQIKLADAMQWFSELEYAARPQISEANMNDIFAKLKQFSIIERIPDIEEICYFANVEVHS